TGTTRDGAAPLVGAVPSTWARAPAWSGRPVEPRCSGFREDLVELLVALADPDLHAARDAAVAALERVDERRRGEAAAPAGQLLEPEAVERDPVGEALVRERLDDELVRAHLVHAAEERVLVAVGVHVDVAVGAAGAHVPVLGALGEVAGAVPAREQLGVDVGPEDLRDGRVELAHDAHDREVRGGDDLGLVGAGGGHGAAPVVGSFSVVPGRSGRSRRTSSRRRYRSSASRR